MTRGAPPNHRPNDRKEREPPPALPCDADAARLGISKAALYYRFPSKAHILLELHLQLHRAMADLQDVPEVAVLFGSAAISDIPDDELEPMMRTITRAVLRGR